jgi:hypothetical protein
MIPAETVFVSAAFLLRQERGQPTRQVNHEPNARTLFPADPVSRAPQTSFKILRKLVGSFWIPSHLRMKESARRETRPPDFVFIRVHSWLKFFPASEWPCRKAILAE